MVLTPPDIAFSPWVRWAARGTHRRTDGPWLGIYLWGAYSVTPGPAAPYPELPEEVIYVGETKHLDRRPLTGRHHRLAHYHDTYPVDLHLSRLYLSICRLRHFPGGYESASAKELYPQLRVYTQFVEARLYWEYTQRWGRLPALHYKKRRHDTGDAGVSA